MAIPIQESNGGVRFAVKVHRLARKNAITGELGDALQSFLNLTTVEGRAHADLDRVLRETFEAAALFRYRKGAVKPPPFRAGDIRRILRSNTDFACIR